MKEEKASVSTFQAPAFSAHVSAVETQVSRWLAGSHCHLGILEAALGAKEAALRSRSWKGGPQGLASLALPDDRRPADVACLSPQGQPSGRGRLQSQAEEVGASSCPAEGPGKQ